MGGGLIHAHDADRLFGRHREKEIAMTSVPTGTHGVSAPLADPGHRDHPGGRNKETAAGRTLREETEPGRPSPRWGWSEAGNVRPTTTRHRTIPAASWNLSHDHLTAAAMATAATNR
jgi:hypothetical protein